MNLWMLTPDGNGSMSGAVTSQLILSVMSADGQFAHQARTNVPGNVKVSSSPEKYNLGVSPQFFSPERGTFFALSNDFANPIRAVEMTRDLQINLRDAVLPAYELTPPASYPDAMAFPAFNSLLSLVRGGDGRIWALCSETLRFSRPLGAGGSDAVFWLVGITLHPLNLNDFTVGAPVCTTIIEPQLIDSAHATSRGVFHVTASGEGDYACAIAFGDKSESVVLIYDLRMAVPEVISQTIFPATLGYDGFLSLLRGEKLYLQTQAGNTVKVTAFAVPSLDVISDVTLQLSDSLDFPIGSFRLMEVSSDGLFGWFKQERLGYPTILRAYAMTTGTKLQQRICNPNNYYSGGRYDSTNIAMFWGPQINQRKSICEDVAGGKWIAETKPHRMGFDANVFRQIAFGGELPIYRYSQISYARQNDALDALAAFKNSRLVDSDEYFAWRGLNPTVQQDARGLVRLMIFRQDAAVQNLFGWYLSIANPLEKRTNFVYASLNKPVAIHEGVSQEAIVQAWTPDYFDATFCITPEGGFACVGLRRDSSGAVLLDYRYSPDGKNFGDIVNIDTLPSQRFGLCVISADPRTGALLASDGLTVSYTSNNWGKAWTKNEVN